MSEITLIATLHVKEAYLQDIRQAISPLVEKSRQETGNLRYDLHQGTEQPNTLVFIEVWASQAAIDHHNQTAHFQQFIRDAEGKLDSLTIMPLHKIV